MARSLYTGQTESPGPLFDLDQRTRQRPRFDGPAYIPDRDDPRLTAQIGRIFALMRDGKWRTLAEVANACGAPEPSVSAQLRHLRKPRFGGHTVERRHDGGGRYSYRLKVREPVGLG